MIPQIHTVFKVFYLLFFLLLTKITVPIAKMDVKYFHYMDEILTLVPTRWKLKKAIRVLNQTFNKLKLEQHPDKNLNWQDRTGV